jgi:hypothetical protein
MGAATEFRSPHRPDAPAYLSTVEDLITYLWLPPRSPLNSVQSPPKANKGRSSLSANQTTSFFLVSGFGSGSGRLGHGMESDDVSVGIGN